MGHIVLATSGSLGDLHPYLAVGLGLKRRGHKVTVATAGAYRQTILDNGLNFAPLRPDISSDVVTSEMMRKALDPRTGAKYHVCELVLPFIEEMYEDLLTACRDADLLLIHPSLFASPLAAEKLNIKWLSVLLAPGSFFSAYDPPLLPPLPWLHAIRFLGPLPQRLMLWMARIATRSWTVCVDDLRRRENSQTVSRYPLQDDMMSPYGVLGWFSTVIGEPQKDWPQPSRATGYAFYAHPSEQQKLSSELTEFLEAGARPVIFTLGSAAVVDPGDFFEQSLEAAKQLGCRAVLIAGEAAHELTAPSNKIFITAYAPYSEVFSRASVVVHQGGAGTLAQTLRAGTPSLVVPLGHDEPDNGFRAKRLGVARVLHRTRYSAANVVPHLRALLEDPRYMKKARDVAEIIRRENGVEAACDAIEEVCAAPAGIGIAARRR
jgi:rhamnosyltransferase subunit B